MGNFGGSLGRDHRDGESGGGVGGGGGGGWGENISNFFESGNTEDTKPRKELGDGKGARGREKTGRNADRIKKENKGVRSY